MDCFRHLGDIGNEGDGNAQFDFLGGELDFLENVANRCKDLDDLEYP